MTLILHFLRSPMLVVAFFVALHGCALLMLGAMGLSSRAFFLQERRERDYWTSFGVSFLIKALGIIAIVLTGTVNRMVSSDAIRIMYLAFSVPASLALFNFAFCGQPNEKWANWRRPVMGGLVTLWLLSGAFFGPEKLSFTYPWLIGAPAGLAGAWVLLELSRHSSGQAARRKRLALAICGVAVGGLALLELFGPGYSDRYQGWTFNTYELYPLRDVLAGYSRRSILSWAILGWIPQGNWSPKQTAFPMNLGCVLAWFAFLSWWAWAKSAVIGVGHADLRWRRMLWALPLSMFVIGAVGFSMVSILGLGSLKKIGRNATTGLRTSELALERDLALMDSAPDAAVQAAAAAELSHILFHIHVSNPDFGTPFLWQLRDGSIDVIAAPPEIPLGIRRKFIDNDPALLKKVEPFPSLGAVRTNGRVYASYHLPILLNGERTPRYWLSRDIPGDQWIAMRDDAELVAVVAIVLIMGVVILAIVYQLKHGAEMEQRFARETAEDAERVKTELLATLSHDVRTPLQSVLAYASLLETTELDERQKDYVGALQEQGRGLLRLLQNLLHLSAAQLGFTPRHDRFSLRRFAEDLAIGARSIAATKGIGFHLRLADDVPDLVIGDEVRMRQIMLNLLSNALKYTESGYIELALSTDEEDPMQSERRWISFVVRDTGPGISPALQAGLFDLKPGRVGAKGRDGVGLGLPLVGRLSLILGGLAQVRNAPGSGAEFTVRLPLVVDRAAATGPVEILAPLIMRARPPRQLNRLLLVEDHDVLRAALGETLTRMGFSVVTAADAASALENWRVEQFDAALIDLGLPDQSGLVLVKTLREDTGARTWFIALTAAHGEEVRQAVSAAGFDRYLPKPAESADLIEALTPADVKLSPAAARAASQVMPSASRDALHQAACQARAEMDEAFLKRDAQAAARKAHHLRNTALMVPDNALANVSREIETALLAASPDWTRAAAARGQMDAAAIFLS